MSPLLPFLAPQLESVKKSETLGDYGKLPSKHECLPNGNVIPAVGHPNFWFLNPPHFRGGAPTTPNKCCLL